MKKAAVILSGCGVYDGAEIHESVLLLLVLSQRNIEYQCFAPDIDQFRVMNHVTGSEMQEKRNVLTEAARIARGQIKNLDLYNPDEFDGLFIPGGFGSAVNLSQWGIHGPDAGINPAVKRAIVQTHAIQKPICALCISPALLALAFKGSGTAVHITAGTTKESSPYDIAAVNEGIKKAGSHPELKTIREICVDTKNKVITAPCYMMDARIKDVYDNIIMAVEAACKLM